MRILVTGATGFIGTAIVGELQQHGHEIVALARSNASATNLVEKDVEIVRGDLRNPDQWIRVVCEVDAIIHAAATFSDDMGQVDRGLIDAMIDQARDIRQKIRFIYTGGCWLYGETGDVVADEESAFDPFHHFDWMIENSSRIFAADCFNAMMVHPAMVYDRDGGAVSAMLSGARNKGVIDVWGSLETRWPVVHRCDLASAYRLVLERGKNGHSYCVSAEDGVPIGEMATVIGQRFGLKSSPHVLSKKHIEAEYGEAALGPTLDQQMSSRKIKKLLGWSPKVESILSEIR